MLLPFPLPPIDLPPIPSFPSYSVMSLPKTPGPLKMFVDPVVGSVRVSPGTSRMVPLRFDYDRDSGVAPGSQRTGAEFREYLDAFRHNRRSLRASRTTLNGHPVTPVTWAHSLGTSLLVAPPLGTPPGEYVVSLASDRGPVVSGQVIVTVVGS